MKLQKIAIATFALGASVAFSGGMGECKTGDVTVPCEVTAWDFGADVLYLKPLLAGPIAFIGSYIQDAQPAFNEDADPNAGWGFKIEGSYHYGTGSDITANWYHALNNTTTKTYSHTGFSYLQPDSFAERYSIKPSWDAVNLEFGQDVEYGLLKKSRFHAGFQYARVKVQTNVQALANQLNQINNDNITTNSTLNGFGIRAGANFTYEVFSNITVNADLAAAALVARSSVDGAAVASGDMTVPSSTKAAHNVVVPVLEAKVSGEYKLQVFNGELDLEVGWMIENYFNAILYESLGQLASTSSDFGLHGLFFGGKWTGNLV